MKNEQQLQSIQSFRHSLAISFRKDPKFQQDLAEAIHKNISNLKRDLHKICQEHDNGFDDTFEDINEDIPEYFDQAQDLFLQEILGISPTGYKYQTKDPFYTK